MAKSISYLSETQSAFLASVPEVQSDEIITGYDVFAAAQYCTPSFLGSRICVGANVVGNAVVLSISATTPLGGVSKSFRFSGNVNFTWKPISIFKVQFKISRFRRTGNSVSFTISIGGCVWALFFGWRCKNFTKAFSIPSSLSAVQQGVLAVSASDDDDESLPDSQEYATLLLLHAMVEKEDGCNCHDED